MQTFSDKTADKKGAPGIELSTPVQFLKGVGPARATVFEQLGVKTTGELLEYFPRDWHFIPPAIKIAQMRKDLVSRRVLAR
jgi:RecG-like helicase